MVETKYISVNTKKQLETIDITSAVIREVEQSSVSNGVVTVFCPGSTGSISTLEYEPGLRKDIRDFFGELVPYRKNWEHHKTWGDDNGSGHILSFLIKTSFTVPVVDNRLTLGTWQQIVFCECDTRPRSRRLVVQIIGE